MNWVSKLLYFRELNCNFGLKLRTVIEQFYRSCTLNDTLSCLFKRFVNSKFSLRLSTPLKENTHLLTECIYESLNFKIMVRPPYWWTSNRLKDPYCIFYCHIHKKVFSSYTNGPTPLLKIGYTSSMLNPTSRLLIYLLLDLPHAHMHASSTNMKSLDILIQVLKAS